MEKSEYLSLAIRAATEAGNFLKKREGIHVDALEGKDIKLSSDKMSEKILMDILEESGLPILSEEYGFKGEEGSQCWIIDPLDGTINYFKGMDEMACVSVALWRDGRPVLGAVNRFMKGELFYAYIIVNLHFFTSFLLCIYYNTMYRAVSSCTKLRSIFYISCPKTWSVDRFLKVS